MDPVELHRRAVSEFDRRVRAIDDSRWTSPTPCTGWNVRTLVNHLVYENKWTSPLLAGKTVDEVGDAFEGDLLGDEPLNAWSEAAREARASVDDAAKDLDRKVNVSWGQIPAADYIDQLWTDHLIHAWDLARAIDGDETLDPDLVAICYEKSAPQEEALKSSGAFGDKVVAPPGADLQTKLLAIFGRIA
jgi:uncharacterized protein (TIGR03086 family)